jgi:tRNA(Glu) U13 pseudouridine synthase TruD
MSTILSLIGNLWPIILGAIGLVVLLWNRIMKKRLEEQGRTIEELRNAEQVHQAKEDIHKKDDQIDQQVDDRVDELEDKIQGKPEQEQAEIVSDTLDDYFKDK